MNILKQYSPIAVNLYVATQLMAIEALTKPVAVNDGSSIYDYQRFSDYGLRVDYESPVQYDAKHSIKSRILSLSILRNNWDGYGGAAPLPEVIGNAIKFVTSIHDFYLSHLDIEDVMPTPHGTINFDWYHEDDYICVEIGKNNIGYFSEINGVSYSTDSNSRISLADLSPVMKKLEELFI